MTWGSNASYDTIPCRWCGWPCIDDTDNGDSMHERSCTERPRWWIGRFLKPRAKAVTLAGWPGWRRT